MFLDQCFYVYKVHYLFFFGGGGGWVGVGKGLQKESAKNKV